MWTKNYSIELLDMGDIADEMNQSVLSVVSDGGDHLVTTWEGVNNLPVMLIQGLGSQATVLRKTFL